MLRTIYLHGALADRFTPAPFRLDCDSVPMLLSGVECSFPGFKKALMELSAIGIIKRTGDKLEAVEPETMAFGFGSHEELHIAAGESGAYGGAAAAFATWVAEYGTVAYYVAYAVAYVAISVAVAYAISAVVTAMADVTSTDGKNAADQRASTLFNGATNSREQGGAVPLLYGEFLVGGVVISGEIVSERIAVALNDYLKVTTGDALTGNVLGNDVLSSMLTLQSFTIGSTTYAAGTTYSSPEMTLSISSTGVVSGTTSFATTRQVTYTAIDGTGLQTSAVLTIEVQDPYVEYSGGGA